MVATRRSYGRMRILMRWPMPRLKRALERACKSLVVCEVLFVTVNSPTSPTDGVNSDDEFLSQSNRDCLNTTIATHPTLLAWQVPSPSAPRPRPRPHLAGDARQHVDRDEESRRMLERCGDP